ncbi:hypothetical protein Tco_0472307 [Tanacetum coccineum]
MDLHLLPCNMVKFSHSTSMQGHPGGTCSVQGCATALATGIGCQSFFNPSDVLACLDFGLFLMLRWSALWLFHAFFVDKFQQRVGYDVMVRVSTIRKTASPARNLPTNLDIFMALGLLQKVLSSPAFLSFSSFIALSPSFSSFPHLRVGLRFCLEGGVSWLSCAGQYVCEADIEYLMGISTDNFDSAMSPRRPLITELRYKADSSDWTDVLSYFCREAADEDRRIATKLNRLRKEILIVCEKRRNLVDELRSIRGIVVVGKAAEFIIDTLRKDNVQESWGERIRGWHARRIISALKSDPLDRWWSFERDAGTKICSETLMKVTVILGRELS